MGSGLCLLYVSIAGSDGFGRFEGVFDEPDGVEGTLEVGLERTAFLATATDGPLFSLFLNADSCADRSDMIIVVMNEC